MPGGFKPMEIFAFVDNVRLIPYKLFLCRAERA
jgi:hypothetical protein